MFFLNFYFFIKSLNVKILFRENKFKKIIMKLYFIGDSKCVPKNSLMNNFVGAHFTQNVTCAENNFVLPHSIVYTTF